MLVRAYLNGVVFFSQMMELLRCPRDVLVLKEKKDREHTYLETRTSDLTMSDNERTGRIDERDMKSEIWWYWMRIWR